MGLSSFNRARRARLEVERLETERFMEDNKRRQAAIRAQDKDNLIDEKTIEKIRKAELDAAQEIGRKTEEGIALGEKGGVRDLPLRQDHAAEIVGRSVEDPQSSTKTPIEHLEARIPTDGTTANEKLVEHTQVDKDGPSAELVEAARLESLPPEEREAAQRDAADERKTAAEATEERAAAKEKVEAQLPAAGDSAGAGKEKSTSSAADKKPAAKK